MAINIKPSHKGLLHKNLGVPQGRKIPASKLAVKSTDSEAVRKRKQFAINAKKWKYEDGGFIDNKSLPEYPGGGTKPDLEAFRKRYPEFRAVPDEVLYNRLPSLNLSTDQSPAFTPQVEIKSLNNPIVQPQSIPQLTNPSVTKVQPVVQQPNFVQPIKEVKPEVEENTEDNLPSDVQNEINNNKQNPNWANFTNKNHQPGHYTVYSKENGNMYLFDREHNLVSSTPAGRGKFIGDDINAANANASSKKGATTPAMRTTIKTINTSPEKYQEYGTPTFTITNPDKYNQVLAIHGIYGNELQKRAAIINNPEILDKLVSYGCINVPKQWINKEYKQGNMQVGDSVFVTKEPLRNQPIKYNQAITKVFAEGGIKPKFEDFYKTVNPDFNDTSTYNLREAYNELPYSQLQAWQIDPENNHLPDTYKLPRHPTFSIESKYYKPGMKAGYWSGNNYIQIGGGVNSTWKPTLSEGGIINKDMKEYKYGGIHIKPENKGKFTAYKERTGKTTEEALHSSNPHVRAMANFAKNAKKWKHGDGGVKDPAKYHLIDGKWVRVMDDGGVIPQEQPKAKLTTPDFNNRIDSTYTKYITDNQTPAKNDSKIERHDIGEHPIRRISNNPFSKDYNTYVPDMDKFPDGGMKNHDPFKYHLVDGKWVRVMAPGGTTGETNYGNAIAPGLQIASDFAANSNNPMLQESLDYGAKGAAMGAPFGPEAAAAGAAIGLTGGAIKGYFDKQTQDAQLNEYNMAQKNAMTFQSVMGRPDQSNLMLKTNQQSLYGKGGVKKVTNNTFDPNQAEELVEDGEAAVTPQGQNIQFNGDSHEDPSGGIPTNLPEGTRIFSDRLKMGNKTFAKLAKPIQNRIEKLEDKPKSKALDNTKMLFNKQLDNIFQQQEQLKAEQEQAAQEKLFAKGGMKKYGGDDNTPGIVTTGKPWYAGQDYVNNDGSAPQGWRDPTAPIIPSIPITTYPSTKDMLEKSYQDEVSNWKAPITTYRRPVNTNPDYTQTDNYNFTNDNPASTTPKTTFNKWGQVGSLASSLGAAAMETANINKVAPPRVLPNIYLSRGVTPQKVDYSAQLNGINADAEGAKEGLRLGSGSYSTQVGNLGKIRAEQLRARGQVLGAQENTNTAAMNDYLKGVNENVNKSMMINSEIGKENMQNEYGFNQWKAGQENAAIAMGAKSSADVFNNMTTNQNQLDAANIMANAHERTVWDQAHATQDIYNSGSPELKAQLDRAYPGRFSPIHAAYGGWVPKKFGNGGTTGKKWAKVSKKK